MKDKNFWQGKRVLITGHTGFKGSWLCIWLRELGAEVVGYGLAPNTPEDNFAVTGLANKMIDIRGDIRDFAKLQSTFNAYKPEIVFHLAAQPLVRESYHYPKETYEINVIGTLHVLECIRFSDTVHVGVMVTTDKCYENMEQIWGYRETDRLGGYDPYSSSKGCAELLIASYRNSFFQHKDTKRPVVASARAGNVIGGGDWAKDRIVPDCMRALMNNETVILRNPEAVRPWQHVLEPLHGYMLLAASMFEGGQEYGSAWNFGPDYDEMIPVGRLVDEILQQWGDGRGREEQINPHAPHEAGLLYLDCSKAKTYLQWRPKLNVKQAIELTVEWYKKFKLQDVYELCKHQIELYSSL